MSMDTFLFYGVAVFSAFLPIFLGWLLRKLYLKLRNGTANKAKESSITDDQKKNSK